MPLSLSLWLLLFQSIPNVTEGPSVARYVITHRQRQGTTLVLSGLCSSVHPATQPASQQVSQPVRQCSPMVDNTPKPSMSVTLMLVGSVLQ